MLSNKENVSQNQLYVCSSFVCIVSDPNTTQLHTNDANAIVALHRLLFRLHEVMKS